MRKKRNSALVYVITVAIFAIFFCLSFFSSKGDSTTFDEVAHIPAGYSYDKYHDFRLNPEHPPLAKAIAGLPLTFMTINGLKSDWSWENISQWRAGSYLLYEAGNDPVQITTWARVPMIILAMLLGLMIFIWAKDWLGVKSALFALTLFAFYPDLLGHSHLVTTDIAAALGFVITIYTFDKMLKKQTFWWIVLAGVAFGLAQVLKFSAFLLYGVLPILVFYRAWLDRTPKRRYWSLFWKYFKYFIWVCIVSLVLVWIVYLPFVWNTPAGIEHKVIEMNVTGDQTLFLRNFLHHFENNVFARALGHYILGVCLVFARVAGGNAVYIMGQVSDKGVAWFFPVAYAIKTPLPILIFLLWSIVSLFVYRAKDKEEKWLNWLLLTPLIVYWAFTLKGSLNIGIRHLMPTVPFVILLIASRMKRYIEKPFKWSLPVAAIIVLLFWLIADVLSYYPQYIAYFNNIVPRDKRYEYLTDSSLDWGQDLYRLRDYVEANHIEHIKIDYFGGSSTKYFIPSQASDWISSYGPTTGWLAVSATMFQSSKLYGPLESKWSYEWLEKFEPKAQIGGSILVYNISQEELDAANIQSAYPITRFDIPGSVDIRNTKISPILNKN